VLLLVDIILKSVIQGIIHRDLVTTQLVAQKHWVVLYSFVQSRTKWVSLNTGDTIVQLIAYYFASMS